MGRSLDEVIENLPSPRRQRIESLAEAKVQEMLAAARTLTDIRKAMGRTQANVAHELGIQQNAISQLEQRSDTYLSTLRRFLKSLGLELELSVVTESGARYSLDSFHPWRDVDAVGDGKGESAPTRPVKERSNDDHNRRTAAARDERATTKTMATRKATASRGAMSSPAVKSAPARKRGA